MSYNCTPHEDIANLGVSYFKIDADNNAALNGDTIVAPWATGRYQVLILSIDEVANVDLTFAVHLEVNTGSGAGSWADYVPDDGSTLATGTITASTSDETVKIMTVDLERLNITNDTEYNSIRAVITVADGTTADGFSLIHYTTGLYNRPGNVSDLWMAQQRVTN